MFEGFVPGAFPGDPVPVEFDPEFPVFEVGAFGFALPDGPFGLVPFCGTVVPETGTHVAAGVVAVPFCCVLCGMGLGAGDVGVDCEVVPGAGSCGAVDAPGPAAFVVIGVGGPIVVVWGGVVLGGAAVVEGAGAGVVACGTVAGAVVVGGGAARRLCAALQFAQASRTSKVVNRKVMRILPVEKTTVTCESEDSDWCF
jgi:hypothetical protein